MADSKMAQRRKVQEEGKRRRQACIEQLLEIITAESSPFTDDELKASWIYFKEGRQLVDTIQNELDRIDAIFGEWPEVRKTVLLGAILRIAEKLA
jgi:hypothetical protein